MAGEVVASVDMATARVATTHHVADHILCVVATLAVAMISPGNPIPNVELACPAIHVSHGQRGLC